MARRGLPGRFRSSNPFRRWRGSFFRRTDTRMAEKVRNAFARQATTVEHRIHLYANAPGHLQPGGGSSRASVAPDRFQLHRPLPAGRPGGNKQRRQNHLDTRQCKRNLACRDIPHTPDKEKCPHCRIVSLETVVDNVGKSEHLYYRAYRRGEASTDFNLRKIRILPEPSASITPTMPPTRASNSSTRRR